MKSLLILHNIAVENANAIAGLTYGFPAISNFLGFTHALSRFLKKDHGLSVGGCAVICHRHTVQAYRPAGWGDYVFGLTRNPLTKKAESAPFVEEGRMHMSVSLVIECDFTADDFALDTNSSSRNVEVFESYILRKILTLRLAGGVIQNVRRVRFVEIPEDQDVWRKFSRQQLFSVLPGFALVSRSELLHEHYQDLRSVNPNAALIDAWLDFSALKYRAVSEDIEDAPLGGQSRAHWHRVEKPAGGWLVPIMTGFKAISPLYQNDEVADTRDSGTPFRFVEAAYTVGQWLSPHRITDLEQLFWRYHVENDWYLCQNNYRPSSLEYEVQSH